ncbi:MAG: 8-amino-7-oxononanoate synthase [Taibaiella sp.]|nr:8-amino-7-oxononanoate synthase [Taibaiella sp.]
MNLLEQYMSGKLDERSVSGNLRSLTTQRAAVDFYSNDYLGLATTGVLAKRILQDAAHIVALRTGSTGSRLLSGNTPLAATLEQKIATFHKAEAALLFNSGYDANVGLLSALADRHTTILYDELCHASIIDGVRLSMSPRKYKFAHNNTEDLEVKLKKYAELGPVMVVVESVYSMDGDMAPLNAIVQLCETYHAQLIIDEAHATGVMGPRGEGLVCMLGLQQRVFARVHTFGKALGCHGAAVVGSTLLKDFLVNYARTFIYTTALPDHSLYAVQCAYQYLSAPDFSHAPLHQLIAYFRHRIADTGISGWIESTSPIQALVVGDNARSKTLATQLQQAGMQVNAILHPTVAQGMERLRICLHTFNAKEQVDTIFDVLCRERKTQ